MIRRAIQKELKIKEGMENMRRVATDRRHLGHVQQLLRASNRRLEQLHGELRELHAQVLLPAPAHEPMTSGPQPRAEQSRARLLEALHRQLEVELKVKQGAENMIHTCASGTPKGLSPTQSLVVCHNPHLMGRVSHPLGEEAPGGCPADVKGQSAEGGPTPNEDKRSGGQWVSRARP